MIKHSMTLFKYKVGCVSVWTQFSSGHDDDDDDDDGYDAIWLVSDR